MSILIKYWILMNIVNKILSILNITAETEQNHHFLDILFVILFQVWYHIAI